MVHCLSSFPTESCSSVGKSSLLLHIATGRCRVQYPVPALLSFALSHCFCYVSSHWFDVNFFQSGNSAVPLMSFWTKASLHQCTRLRCANLSSVTSFLCSATGFCQGPTGIKSKRPADLYFPNLSLICAPLN